MASKALETQGVEWKRGDGGSPEVFTAVKELIDFNGPDGSANEIDITNLASVAREFLMGVPDEGNYTFELNYDPTDGQQTGLQDDRANRTKRNFELLLSDTPPTKFAFAGFVKEFSTRGGVDEKISASTVIKISGAVVRS